MATDPEPAPMSQTVLVGADVELRQSDGANLCLGDQAPPGLGLGKRLVGIAEEAMPAGPAGSIGPVRLAHQDQHVEGIELHRRQVGELGLRDPLVGRTQVLADIGTEVVDSPLQQLASHARAASARRWRTARPSLPCESDRERPRWDARPGWSGRRLPSSP